MGEENQVNSLPHKAKSRPALYYIILIIKLLSYDLVLWFFNLVIHTFFRDVQSRGSFNIPRRGPVIFVIAPHHNQFVDGLVVMAKVKEHSGRRIAFLIAQKSYDRRIIGEAAKLCSAIPVERAQDLLKKGTGKIYVDKEDDRVIRGSGTKFTSECQVKGLIGLPNSLGNGSIQEIFDDEKLILKKPFTSPRKEIQQRIDEKLQEGTEFKIAPHIDNHIVFQNVFTHLNDGKVLGIFPEGGSHDRPDLLPLKPGVAIMALGAIAQQIEALKAGKSEHEEVVPVSIVPVGLNYFHPHKFRSRVVIEFGKPIIVDEQMAEQYEMNSREAVDKLLKTITLGLKEVTMTCNDYETLMVLQAARRLYTSGNRDSIPLPMVIEMNRRLIKGYEKYKDQPDVKELKEAVLDYNKKLRALNLHDHQVESLDRSNRVANFWRFTTRFFKFSLFMGLSLPGIFLFSPVFIISRRISRKKAKEALAASVVKIKAKDVLSTWKILVAMVLAPMLYIFWSVIGTILIVKSKILGDYQPSIWFIFIYFYGWAVLTTYASLRMGEIGIDYYKSLAPLFLSVLSINEDRFQIEKLKQTRGELRERVNIFCNKFGPGMFDDFEQFYRQYNGTTEDEEFDIITLQKQQAENQFNKLQRQTSASSLDFNLSNLSDIPIFAAADLEQANDVNLTKESEEIEKERSREDSETNDEKVEELNNEAESTDGPKMRIRKAMKEKYSNLD
ncbi:Sct2 glycerol-3-phosphate acyltransferase [Candida orthopsilosis Co 90-125]|uniref:Sct2 glycerol-3-phosphate acyltransferase n=1 Tax=Candida orthopsilosis (strain 90-125) TaxID=1136231 RepID=H8WX78_CANO9|nr:Sct2 glycerol-3-phosphate acyltransferase [Candida orthopsilosis Co 90-125]CCG21383.1 Sct2 glycerol-3-phosphate acyltransferase [Candida orthopsilosis Co 90-125]